MSKPDMKAFDSGARFLSVMMVGGRRGEDRLGTMNAIEKEEKRDVMVDACARDVGAGISDRAMLHGSTQEVTLATLWPVCKS